MGYKILRPVAILVLFFFSWTFLGIYNLAYAISNSSELRVQSSESKAQRPEEKLQKGIEDITQTIERVKKVKTHEELINEKERLRTKRQEIEGNDEEIKKQFAETEQKIKGLPDEIKQRHKDFVKKYEENLNTLKRNLDDIEKAETAEEVKVEVEKAKTFLEKVRPPKKHIPLDPNKLPHRKAEPTKKKPRIKKEDFEKEAGQIPLYPPLLKGDIGGLKGQGKPILLASIGDLQGILTNVATQALVPPTQADLSETIEIQFTKELREIATLLENNPVYLYEFVRNNFVYEPYYGSVKGSQSTLLLQRGNDFDQASLLIALLRVSNIPARYVYGTVEIPIEKLMDWIGGVTDPNIAAQVFATGGIPGKLITEGGKIKYVQMEHVWVEAYVPYGNYRGVLNDPTAPKTWIPLDPSFKVHVPNPNAIDMAELQGFDIDNYFSTYLQTVKPTTPAKEYLRNTINYVNNNLAGQSFYDLLASGPISDKILGLLPNTLPYPVKVVGARFSSIPDSYSHHISLQLIDPNFDETILSYTASWSTLLHKRFTLSYVSATTLDEQTIAAYGGIYSTPPYLIRVKPVLKVEGITVAEGMAVNMAYDITCQMNFYQSGNVLANVETNILTIGAPIAIGLGAGYTTGRIITYRASKLELAVNSGQSGEPILGEYLNLLALNYLQEFDSSRKMIAKTMKLLDTNRVAELMVGVDLGVSYIFNVPRAVNISGLFIDVDYNISTLADITGDQTKVRRFQILSGTTSSALEHTMFETIIGAEAVSAIKALQIANVQGIPIYRIDSNNISTILPILQLSSEVKTDIQNAVQTGKVVTVSEQNIQLNDWNGVGYIILDPVTGAGAYMINGISGGHLTTVTSALQSLINAGKMTKDEAKKFILDHKKSIWFFAPVEGSIKSGFKTKDRPNHKGVDFSVPIGSSVNAVADGIVTRAEYSTSFGNVIYIDHGAGVETRYAHNCELWVSNGQKVITGEYIARSGNTGEVESDGKLLPADYPRCIENDPKGAHVHFEILLNGDQVDPESFFMIVY
jgi:murein DD-endopeptidase MepM/ murein hydrolase activator NlpD